MIIVVRLLPPNESRSRLVSFESLYGTCFAPLHKELMTMPSAERDPFIFFASSRRKPKAPVLDTFSDPARSTKNNLDFLLRPLELSRWMKVTDRIL